METLNLKTYGDYRDFLKAHFKEKQSQNKTWSQGLWARRLGLKGTSSLTKILTGEREPGKVISDKFIHYFNFNENETSYFCDLIRLSKIKDDPRLKVMLMEKMGREYPDANLRILDDKSFTIISNWFGMAIREMVRLEDFQEDPVWIQSRLRFPVQEREIQQTLVDLLQQGLIKRTKLGNLVSSMGILRTTDDVSSEAIKSYHEQMLDNAKISLREVNVEMREFTAETLTINTANIPAAKQLIREFKAKFSRLLEEQKGNETYQLQIQFFPISKELKDENSH